MILLYFTLVLFIIYASLVLWYAWSWSTIPVFDPGEEMPKTKFSLIIPARNEEHNIGELLMALQGQDYPKDLLEIIVVDDHSEDKTAEIVNKYPGVKLISLKADKINSYKKAAINAGIESASGDWIITTDADCFPSENWLKILARFKEQNKPVFIAAPVVVNCDNSVLQIFQAMDFMILQGITGASVHRQTQAMCNGANLAYAKDIFHSLNGFSDIDQIASGDDMLLMYKFWKAYPGKVQYLKAKGAIVSTQPMKTWKDFFNQRIRWASKARMYDDKRIFPVLLLVYLLNLSILAMIIAGFWRMEYWFYFIGFWIAKTLVEFPLLSATANFFSKKWIKALFFFFQPLHILYTVTAGFFGQMGKYRWKGRTVK